MVIFFQAMIKEKNIFVEPNNTTNRKKMHIIQAENYQVFVGSQLMDALNDFLLERQAVYSDYFILVDENTEEHCLDIILDRVGALENASVLTISSGEENKNIETCIKVWDQLLKMNAGRNTLIINLGGGVLGDMGGFIASTYKRGVDFLNIPTTLLSQVDASVGGKLGVDFNGFKNVIGCFNNPIAVFADQQFFKTLPERELRSGFAEVMKHGLIKDAKYFQSLNFSSWKTHDWSGIVKRSIEIKNEVVLNDPYEAGLRKILNFGHTIGHAIETYFLNTKNRLLHGEAIAWGMVAETALMVGLEKAPKGILEEVFDKFNRVFDLQPINELWLNELIGLMYNDKKNQGGEISFAIINAIGTCEERIVATPEQVKHAISNVNQMISGC